MTKQVLTMEPMNVPVSRENESRFPCCRDSTSSIPPPPLGRFIDADQAMDVRVRREQDVKKAYCKRNLFYPSRTLDVHAFL
jgi:hypothetical protein